MEFIYRLSLFFAFFCIVSSPEVQAQSPDRSVNVRSLNALLQNYAYKAFHHPRTGVIYNAQVPSNLSGITISVLRLRSGSLRKRGIENYKEFEIPIGVLEQPYVERLALVYHNLGNWSSTFYSLRGYTFLAPVIGLLAYDAANISAKNSPELYILASQRPILIKFTDVKTVPNGSVIKCVWFDLDGLPQFINAVSSNNVCSAFQQGHFSIVVESSDQVSGLISAKKGKSKAGKIVGAVIGVLFGLVLSGFIGFLLRRCTKKTKMEKIERKVESGGDLRLTSIRSFRIPVATGARTRPILENEYAA